MFKYFCFLKILFFCFLFCVFISRSRHRFLVLFFWNFCISQNLKCFDVFLRFYFLIIFCFDFDYFLIFLFRFWLFFCFESWKFIFIFLHFLLWIFIFFFYFCKFANFQMFWYFLFFGNLFWFLNFYFSGNFFLFWIFSRSFLILLKVDFFIVRIFVFLKKKISSGFCNKFTYFQMFWYFLCFLINFSF